MKCCKKFVAIAVLVALGIFTVSAIRHGWGTVVKNHVTNAFKSNVPPEVQLERVKGLIKELDADIAKGWTPIATRMEDIKDLKKDLEQKTSKLETVKAEMQTAAKALEDNQKRISYNNRDYTQSEVRKALNGDLAKFKGLSREVEAKTRLLAAWQRGLDAMKANQDEMRSKKADLETQVAQIEADLKVLKLAQTSTPMPTGNGTNLDEIKATLREVERQIEIQRTALDLASKHDRGENVSDTSTRESDADLIKKIKEATGDKDAEDGVGK